MDTVSHTAAPAPAKQSGTRRPRPHIRYALRHCTPDTLICVCRALRARGYRGDSAAYTVPGHPAEQTCFYLAVEEEPPGAAHPIPPTAILDEYGTRIAAASMLVCLSEHAVCIAAHHAVEQLAALYISQSEETVS